MVALKKFFKSDWALAGLFLGLFLLTNRYIYGWDDQHLEITLLKHLIDPRIYQGDYYVESLKNNFTSFLFPILARIIKVDWIPAVYLAGYIIARYFMFFFMFRLWNYISGSRWIAALCTAAVFLLIRPEEFIYRTFSHQEASYIFVFSGLLLFYRGRFLWAALVWGLGINIHALYNLFPMAYMGAYLLFFHKERKWELILKSTTAFFTAAMPFLVWTVMRAMTTRHGQPPGYYDGWIEMYHLSCPQNFIFDTKTLAQATVNLQTFFSYTKPYFFLLVLFLLNWRFSRQFRKDHKAHAIVLTMFIFLAINFLFTYIWPSHFVLDLNLIRNEQYALFFLGGYTLVIACREGQGKLIYSLAWAALVTFLAGKELWDVGLVLSIAALLELFKGKKISWGWFVVFAGLAMLFLFAAGTWHYTPNRLNRLGMTAGFMAAGALLYFLMKPDVWKARAKQLIVASSLFSGLIFFCYLHYNFVQISTKGGGFWQLQRNWENMQIYVRDHTPLNAMILAPNDMEMGGFRIHSNRRVVVCYRDCGIIGFDYGATKEWKQRMADIDAFKVFIKEPFTQALINGIYKYGADYVVFMKYAAPPDNALLKKMYENEVFSLYKVTRN